MPRAAAGDVLFVSKASKKRVALLAMGQNLTAKTGYSIEDLQVKAVRDRLVLARAFLKSTEAAVNENPTSYRFAVSRAYYAMYHALRAVSYFYHGGDDFEEHKKLPSGIPPSFPDRSRWENDLKTARLERNRADYDPYPKNDAQFQPVALQMLVTAKKLLPVARDFLRRNGCQL